MDNYLVDFGNNRFRSINMLTLLLIVFEIGFLCIIGNVFMDVITDSREVAGLDVGNLSENIGEVRNEIDNGLKTALYNLASLNLSNDQNINIYGALIRDDSLVEKSFTKFNREYFSFIVDIPDIEQSYWVWYDKYISDVEDLSGGVPEVMVVCLSDYESKIYDDFACRDESNGLTRNFIVKNYLRYTDFDGFIAYVDPKDDGMKHVRIVSNKYEYTDEDSERYMRETREFIKSLGISPDLFEYTVESAPLGETDEPVYVY